MKNTLKKAAMIAGGVAVAVATPANAAGERITYDVTSNGPLLSVSFYDQMNEMQSLTNLGRELRSLW